MEVQHPADLETALVNLSAPVKLVCFTQTFDCESCLPARQAVDQIAACSEQITVEEFNVILDKTQARTYGIERVPAVAVVGQVDTGIRFYGVPDGYELVSLVQAILLVGSGESGLSDESRSRLAEIQQPVTIQVFVTPT